MLDKVKQYLMEKAYPILFLRDSYDNTNHNTDIYSNFYRNSNADVHKDTYANKRKYRKGNDSDCMAVNLPIIQKY